MMNFSEWLGNLLSPDQAQRELAEKNLLAASNENFPQYVITLATELANEANPPQVRSAAGIAIKNTLQSRDAAVRTRLANRWLALDALATDEVKQKVLAALSTPLFPVASQAAQAVAIIASVELPIGKWQNVLDELLQSVRTGPTPSLVQSALTTIGYICEQTPPDVLRARSSDILTAVVYGAGKSQKTHAIQVAALRALYNSLEFVRENFQRENERNYIMSVVCEATQIPNDDVVVAAFECLGRIMNFYYEYMDAYMEKALFQISIMGIRNESESIVKQAIEFWSTICEEEIEVREDFEEAIAAGEGDTLEGGLPVFHNFAKADVPTLSVTLMNTMKKQDEDADDEDWTAATAAATCLQLLAQCVGDDILQGGGAQFIEQNIVNQEDWRARDAAVMAFGSVLEGPEPKSLIKLATQALPVLITLMRDENLQVKDSTAWAISRLCEQLIQDLDPRTHAGIVEVLLQSLNEKPRVITHCCSALMHMAENLVSETGVMTQFFQDICAGLLAVGARADNENRSRTSAYVALAKILERAADSLMEVIAQVIVELLTRLEQTISSYDQVFGRDAKNNTHEIQSSILTALTPAIRRMSKEQVSQISDRIMTDMLSLLKQHHARKNETVNTEQEFHSSQINMTINNTENLDSGDTVVEDVFLLISALTSSLEADFHRYLSSVADYLMAALNNPGEYNLCTIAVGVAGDLCRALGNHPDMTRPHPEPAEARGDQPRGGYVRDIMHLLVKALHESPVHKVKPVILSCFGDIALSVGEHFDQYLPVVMAVLARATSVKISPDEYEMYDYMTTLREGIKDAYTGVVINLKMQEHGAMKLLSTQEYLEQILKFIMSVAVDPDRNETLVSGVIALLGDLAEMFNEKVSELQQAGPQTLAGIRSLYQQPWVADLLQEAMAKGKMKRYSYKTKRYAKWATVQIQSLVAPH